MSQSAKGQHERQGEARYSVWLAANRKVCVRGKALYREWALLARFYEGLGSFAAVWCISWHRARLKLAARFEKPSPAMHASNERDSNSTPLLQVRALAGTAPPCGFGVRERANFCSDSGSDPGPEASLLRVRARDAGAVPAPHAQLARSEPQDASRRAACAMVEVPPQDTAATCFLTCATCQEAQGSEGLRGQPSGGTSKCSGVGAWRHQRARLGDE